MRRKVNRGETIYVKVEHVDPFFDRLVLKEYRHGVEVEFEKKK